MGSARSIDAITDRYLTMTRQALGQGATFIIWPESSTPFYFEHDLVRGGVDPAPGDGREGDAADRQRSGRAGSSRSRG